MTRGMRQCPSCHRPPSRRRVPSTRSSTRPDRWLSCTAAERPRRAENSLLTFQRALDLGFTYLETDVHATADGVLVAVHDPTLDRVADRPGRISELPWADVARARLADGSPIPRLPELLEVLPQARITIDVKADDAVGPVVRLLQAHPELAGADLHRQLLGPPAHGVRRRLGPRLCTSTGPAGVVAHRMAAAVRRPTPTRYLGNCLQVPIAVGRADRRHGGLRRCGARPRSTRTRVDGR